MSVLKHKQKLSVFYPKSLLLFCNRTIVPSRIHWTILTAQTRQKSLVSPDECRLFMREVHVNGIKSQAQSMPLNSASFVDKFHSQKCHLKVKSNTKFHTAVLQVLLSGISRRKHFCSVSSRAATSDSFHYQSIKKSSEKRPSQLPRAQNDDFKLLVLSD